MKRLLSVTIVLSLLAVQLYAEEQKKPEQQVAVQPVAAEAKQEPAPQQGLNPAILLQAHLLSLANTGQSPFTDTDPKNGEKPVAVVDLGAKKVTLWQNHQYDSAAARAVLEAKPQQQPVQQVNAEKLISEQNAFLRFWGGQQPEAPSNEVVVKNYQMMDPALAAYLARQEQRQKLQDFGDAMSTFGDGTNKMFGGVADSLRRGGEILDAGGRTQVDSLRTIFQLNQSQLNRRR